MSSHNGGFDEEPPINRQGACEINTYPDHDTLNSNRSVQNYLGSAPYYPPSNHIELTSIRYGDVVVRKKGAYSGESKLYGLSSMAGEGAEEASLFPNDPEMIKNAIKSRYDVIGIAVTEYNPEKDAPDQGYVSAVTGSCSVPKMVQKVFEPGQFVVADLPENDLAAKMVHGPNGQVLAKYGWVITPEQYSTPGDRLISHMNAVLDDDQKWKQCMSQGSALDVDKWLACTKAMGDSSLTGGLLMIYVLMKFGFLRSTAPAQPNPYSGEGPKRGGIVDGMTADGFAIRMSQLLGLQTNTNRGGDYDPNYFSSLRRLILKTIFFNGRDRVVEFGQRPEPGATVLMNARNGSNINPASDGGQFLQNQIDHSRKMIGACLQALDDHLRFRIGKTISGPNRKKRINLVLGSYHV